MYKTRFPITLSIAVCLSACDSGTVVVDGDGHAHANGNCNGKNNCNNNEADSQVTTVSSDSGDSGDSGDETSTSGVPDMADSTDTGTDTGETGESETGDPEPEPDPGLPGCGNGLPFAGDLCYHPHVQYNITTARNAKIGDMNGDGHADVMTLSTTQLATYLGNGTGALAVSSFVGATTSSLYLALGDIDGDGDLDVATTGPSQMRVHFNNGAGVLSLAVTYTTFQSPRETILADLDADGDLDLAQSHNGNERKVAVRKNNGFGSFGPQTAYEIETTSFPTWLVASDFDGDDALDLLVGTNVNPVILYNYGNGTFDAINEQTVVISTNLGNLVVDDFDLDGHLDIAGARVSAPAIRVIYGTGQGMYDPMMLDVPSAVLDTGPLISADFDADGIPDLAVANDEGGVGQVGIHRGDGYGTFYDAVVLTSKNDATNLTSGDLNGDDVLDLVMVSDGGSPGLSVLRSNP